MAAPSALSRLMQFVNPISALSLSPAGRILFLKDQQAGRSPEDAVADESSRSTPTAALRLSTGAQSDPLPVHAAGTACRLSFEPDCTLASDADQRPGPPTSSSRRPSASRGWRKAGDTAFVEASTALATAGPGLGYAPETALLPAQAEALRRNGRRSTIAQVPDPSPASLDAFAADLINSQQLEDAFYIMDIGTLDRLFLTWQTALPRVMPFYAVKCNPSPILLSVLEVLGAGFDCASEAEIKQVLSMGVSPDRIIFANPCKMPSHIKYASKTGVATTTFDSEAELDKIQALYPDANLVLRIQTRDSGARCPLGTKYGALPEEVEGLLEAAAQRNLAVTGVSFHVGSGASDASAYHSAIAAAHDVFQKAAAAGRPMSLLDIGGGFTAPREVPGVKSEEDSAAAMNFFQAAQAINAALDEFFPADCGVNIIAEPGRYFAETPSTLVARIFGKRVRGLQREYWINDGLYGSMNCTLYDHAVLSARPLPLASSPSLAPSHQQAMASGMIGAGFFDKDGNPGAKWSEDLSSVFSSTVFGPTCDGLDVIFRAAQLPDLQMGDWLMFPNMGAYTAAAGSSFNGFATSQINTHLIFSSSMKTNFGEGGTTDMQSSARTSSGLFDLWAGDVDDASMALAQLG